MARCHISDNNLTCLISTNDLADVTNRLPLMHNVNVMTSCDCSFKNAIMSQITYPITMSPVCLSRHAALQLSGQCKSTGCRVAKDEAHPKPNAQCMGKIFLCGMYCTQPNNLKIRQQHLHLQISHKKFVTSCFLCRST